MLKGIGVTTSVFAIESVSADANILIVRSVAWSNDRILNHPPMLHDREQIRGRSTHQK
jgi:hypothetical protein